MAVIGPFILMINDSFEHTKIYKKLYLLVTRPIFMAKHRAEFFEEISEETNLRCTRSLEEHVRAVANATVLFDSGKSGIDVFDDEKGDLQKANAMRSHLSEIDTLRHHCCRPVSRYMQPWTYSCVGICGDIDIFIT
ncbi:hypothetical protein RND81_O271700 [Saponaria officinalis]|uniref:CCAAT-binding factor domain-containing protein n=1 Tax=Saponaria officinalis TaxID=3572 RepID=A0AAW1GFU2_SAPOF